MIAEVKLVDGDPHAGILDIDRVKLVLEDRRE
jgi:hypothetical protein